MQANTPNPALSRVILGGLALHGRLSASAIMCRAEAMCLGPEAAGRAVNDLIAQRLASVKRDDNATGEVIATPAISALSRSDRVGAILTFLAQAQAVTHA